MKKLMLFIIIAGLGACGGSGDGGSVSDNPSSGAGSASCSSALDGLTTSDSTDSFSSTGVLASVTQTEDCTSSILSSLSLAAADIVPNPKWDEEAQKKHDEAWASGENEDAFPDCQGYIVEASPGEGPECFGPELSYQNHLDGQTKSGGEGNLNCDDNVCAAPTGDLGIWTATEGDTDEACAAAKINSDIEYVSSFTNMSKDVQAIVECLAQTGKINEPTDGQSNDITSFVNDAILNEKLDFQSATWALSGTDYTIRLIANSSDANGEINITSNNSSGEFINIWGYFGGSGEKTSSFVAAPNSYLAFSLYGVKSGTAVNQKFISAVFENTAPNTDSSTGDFDSDNMLKLDSSWTMDHRTILLNDPGDTNDKLMKYSWIAGKHTTGPDDYSRTFFSKVNAADTVGYAYYGYGKSTARMDITNFFCNWNGPNQKKADDFNENLAQKQRITKSVNGTIWTTTESDSEITYAPVNSCASDNSDPSDNTIDTRALDVDSLGDTKVPGHVAGTSPMVWGLTSDNMTQATAFDSSELINISTDSDASAFSSMTDPTD